MDLRKWREEQKKKTNGMGEPAIEVTGLVLVIDTGHAFIRADNLIELLDRLAAEDEQE